MKTINAHDIKSGMWVCRIYSNGEYSPFKEVFSVKYLHHDDAVKVETESRFMYFDLLEEVGVK